MSGHERACERCGATDGRCAAWCLARPAAAPIVEQPALAAEARNANGVQIGAAIEARSAPQLVQGMNAAAYTLRAIDGFTVSRLGIVRVTRSEDGRAVNAWRWMEGGAFVEGDAYQLEDAIGRANGLPARPLVLSRELYAKLRPEDRGRFRSA